MSIEGAIFRSNPLYDLVLLDRLSSEERSAIAEIEGGIDLYGVLRPLGGSPLPPRAVSEETALLFLTLREAGPLPGYVRRRLGGEVERTASRLVLDGVLELQEEGTYRSGPSAAGLLGSSRDGGGRLAALSIEALRYGQALESLPTEVLAMRLYLYGRRPVTAALRRRLPTAAAVAEYLGLEPGGGAQAVLRSWAEERLPGDRPAWRLWRPRRRPPRRDPDDLDYKLYVSTGLDEAPKALRVVAETLVDVRGTSGFKSARDLDGLCRPDKLVAYFARFEDLLEAASRLRPHVDALRPHGVPFTAPIDRDGLLSWGVDPPKGRDRRSQISASWRMWVTNRLAEYLTAARGSVNGEPWRFALERLRLDGVDTATWVPTRAARDGELAWA